MTAIRIFKNHRNWEDWLGMLLGILIGLSPWFAGYTDSQLVTANALLFGALVLMFAQLELVSLRRWEEIAEILCGLWVMGSPFIFGYAGTGELRYWHFGLGAIVVLLALLELWQDWKLNDRELAKHGQ